MVGVPSSISHDSIPDTMSLLKEKTINEKTLFWVLTYAGKVNSLMLAHTLSMGMGKTALARTLVAIMKVG